MANTYTKAYFHIVFAVKNRQALIQKEWKDELEKYITAIIQKHKHKLIAIGAVKDHIHILIGYDLNQLIPDLVEEVKTSSNSWIKTKKLCKYKFEWQRGYGAFSHARSQITTVANYIANQEIHHKKKTFKEEYLEVLNKNEIQFKDEFLFYFFE